MSKEDALRLVSLWTDGRESHLQAKIPAKTNTRLKLNLESPEVFRDQAYVNGEWVEAKSGKRFEIVGMTASVNGLRMDRH